MTKPGSPAADDASRAWSMLWDRTVRGSIDLDADDPVSQALREHWVRQLPWLAVLPNVVDVGSGPAVLARHLHASAPAGTLDALTWWCVDAAALPPTGWQAPQLHGMGETDFASAAPPGGPCAGLVSNFGLEYVTRTQVANACARWLVPGSELRAVVHASGSVIDLTAARTLDDIDHALSGVRLFDRAHELLQAMSTLPTDPAQRQQHGAAIRNAYNLAVDDLKKRMAERGQRVAVWIDMLTALTGLTRLALDGQAPAALARCAELWQAYGAETLRLRAMRASAIGPHEQAALAEAFAEAGLSRPTWEPIQSTVGLVAWHLKAHR